MDGFFMIAGLIILVEAFSFWSSSRDSTDQPKVKKHWWWPASGERSGLRVYVDHETGVQYVKASMFDKLQVRINKDGTPYTGE